MKVRNLPADAGTSASARAVRAVLTLVLAAGCACALADTYHYDARGDVESIISPRGVRTYDYDERQRLWLEQGYTGNREHEYDRNGNRATDGATAPGSPTLATYVPDSNRIATLNGGAVTVDAAGQITNDGLNTYTWDAAGRLKTVSRDGQLRATYHYDHRHRRTRKVTTAAAPQGAQSIRYQYDDRDRLMAETTDTGVPLRSYVRADDRLVAIAEHVAQGGVYQIRMLYLELDHLGTPRQARREGGTVVWRWESDGYGTIPADEDPDGDGQKTSVYLRFPGQYYDEESGLHYNWHRYYVPRLGRYLSSDPIGVAGGINTFGYVGGNPVSYTDPDGLNPVWRGILAGAKKARDVWRDTKWDGPRPSRTKPGEGMVCQIRYKQQPVFRIDVHPIDPEDRTPVLHWHIAPDMQRHHEMPAFIGDWIKSILDGGG